MPTVQTSIDWSDSISCKWRLMRVDPATWADSEEVLGVVGASIKRDSTGKLFESGSISIERPTGTETDDGQWVRIEVLAEQGSMIERHAVATFKLAQKDSVTRRGLSTFNYDAASVLEPAEKRTVKPGSFAARGEDGASVVAALLSECTPAPIEADGSFALQKHVVFAKDTSKLDAALSVLEDSGWCIQVDVQGRIHIRPLPSSESLTIDMEHSKLLGTSVTIGDGTRHYERAWVPGITAFDVIEGRLVEAGLLGPMRVRSQSISIGNHMSVDEECEML